MRIYRIKLDHPNKLLHRSYAGSEAEARKVRASLMVAEEVQRKYIDIEPIDIPTNKQDLLVFLNASRGVI